MTRTVPGSGAAIEPVFNSVYGVKDVIVTNMVVDMILLIHLG